MPYFQINGKPHYLAHVPKRAGQAVKAYLAKRFGALAFCDSADRTSPQHIDVEALGMPRELYEVDIRRIGTDMSARLDATALTGVPRVVRVPPALARLLRDTRGKRLPS